MKVLLFNPPDAHGTKMTREGRCTQRSSFWGTQWPPLTLAVAAAMLEADGHRVLVRDFPATGENGAELCRLVRQEQPDAAYWATATPTIASDLAWGAALKQISPRIITGVFGTHVTALPEEALAVTGIDLVLRREPEETIRRLCQEDGDRIYRVAGISFRDPTGVVRSNDDAALLEPEMIPAPAWHLLPALPYTLPLKRRPFLIIAPIRGCPFPCSFCTASIYYGKKLRRRPVTAVLDEMEQNIRRHGIRDFFIWADTFTADPEYVRELCRGIQQRGLNISWTCNSRVDTVDAELLRAMKEAGLWMLSFGIESGSDAVLCHCRKGITAGQSRRAVYAAHDLGLRVAGHFIFGLPGETAATMKQTTTFALSLPLDIAQFYAAAPFPGTPFFDEATANNWFQASSPSSQSTAIIHLPGLTAAAINRAKTMAYLRFYLRPRTLLRLLAMTIDKPTALL